LMSCQIFQFCALAAAEIARWIGHDHWSPLARRPSRCPGPDDGPRKLAVGLTVPNAADHQARSSSTMPGAVSVLTLAGRPVSAWKVLSGFLLAALAVQLALDGLSDIGVIMTLGSTKFSSSRLAARTINEHDCGLAEAAVAEGDDDGQPAVDEGADVGDVAADEVGHHDGEHQRESEQEGGDADDHRHDGGHDGAAAAVVAQDPDGVADEGVGLVPEPGVDLGDQRAPEPGAVLEQVVPDQGAQDQAAGEAAQRAEAGDRAVSREA
jgi:hypothetical protein